MTPRERIACALEHRQPDRVPIDLGSNGQTGMNVSTLYRFRRELGLPEHPIKVIEPAQMLGEIEDDLMKIVGGDVMGLWNRGNFYGFLNENWKPWALDDGTPVYVPGAFEVDVDENGVKWLYARGDRSSSPCACMPEGGSFFDAAIRGEPFDWDIDEDDLTPVDDFKDDFAVASDEDASYWEAESRRLYEETDYAIMGVLGGGGLGDVAVIPGPHITSPRGIRLVSDWLMAHALFPDYVAEVFEYQTGVMMKNLEIYRQSVGERISVIWVSGTDFGTQNGLFTSKETFRKLYKPYYERINGWIHENTGWKTFYHTCGCVNDLLDDFAQMGVDCLNPVQVNAIERGGISARELKDRWGDRFVFWGGGVDTQKTLPFGTPEEVRAEVTERASIFNRGGGFVFSSIHNVVAKVPAENLAAMYEAVLGRRVA
ncbi:MAG: hypothetical protein LBS53_02965 [Synergistaceae bacterium]|jgi:hypothetical protein|nr:hypothetical protein [Synergistaceae bacterium]